MDEIVNSCRYPNCWEDPAIVDMDSEQDLHEQMLDKGWRDVCGVGWICPKHKGTDIEIAILRELHDIHILLLAADHDRNRR